MTLEQLAREVVTMRDCQRAYFRLRSSEALAASKTAERRLDKLVEGVLNPPPAPRPGLFDEGPS